MNTDRRERKEAARGFESKYKEAVDAEETQIKT